MARRDEREYREYLNEEQRSQPGCRARELCREPRGRDISEASPQTDEEPYERFAAAKFEVKLH